MGLFLTPTRLGVDRALLPVVFPPRRVWNNLWFPRLKGPFFLHVSSLSNLLFILGPKGLWAKFSGFSRAPPNLQRVRGIFPRYIFRVVYFSHPRRFPMFSDLGEHSGFFQGVFHFHLWGSSGATFFLFFLLFCSLLGCFPPYGAPFQKSLFGGDTILGPFGHQPI